MIHDYTYTGRRKKNKRQNLTLYLCINGLWILVEPKVLEHTTIDFQCSGNWEQSILQFNGICTPNFSSGKVCIFILMVTRRQERWERKKRYDDEDGSLLSGRISFSALSSPFYGLTHGGNVTSVFLSCFLFYTCTFHIMPITSALAKVLLDQSEVSERVSPRQPRKDKES